ncbi:MAG: hypothetical protein IJJ03_03710 [Mogibacterium sp.]|nr:hypothetical protein [Mogibacterium sp.]MBQ6501473.1 hypothetical protein [Mogibacterium sp.]
MSNNQKQHKVQFYLGDIGAIIPFVVMLVILVALVISGHKSAQNYWTAAFSGIVVAYLLCKDKHEFNSMMFRSLQDKMFAPLFLTFIFSGIFSKSLTIGGLAKGILWAATKIGVGPAFFPAAMFIIGCILSTSMGTSSGTIVAMVPIFLPTAVALGCNPVVTIGAIVSGAYFGDNLAPISDTTIASAGTQGISVGECVRTRLKYSISAGLLTLIVLVFFGFTKQVDPMIIESVAETNPTSLILIIAPILLIILVVKGVDLIPALLIATITSIVLGLVTGLITLENVYDVEGIVATGTTSMIGIMMLTTFTFLLNRCITESGAMDNMIGKLAGLAKTPRSTELLLIAICALIVIMVPSNSTAIVVAAPFAYRLIKAQNMEKTRGSNIMDGICVSVSGLIPYGAGVLTAHSLAISCGVMPETFSPIDFIPFNIYNILLICVFIFAGITGWGRKFTDRSKDDDQIEAA